MSTGLTLKISHALCAILLVQTLGQLQLLARCQSISDGDDQFEAVHQDIGRISGLSAQGSPQVAPKSSLVARQPAPQFAADQSQLVSPPAASVQLAPSTVAQVFERGAATPSQHQSRGRGHQSSGARKPNRITLVARRDPTPSTLTTLAQPALIAAQLPAPPQQQQQQQQHHALGAAQEQPSFTPSFAPLAPAPIRVESAAAAAAPPSGPALNSFRSTVPSVSSILAPAPSPATVGSVSARHSALMAQVAAERAHAASLIGSEPAPSGLEPLGLAPPESSPAETGQALASQTSGSSFASQALAPPAQQQLQPVANFAAAAAATTAQGHHASAAPLGQALEEPAVAPSFEHVLGHGCPHRGVFSWDNKEHCDRYYLCTNGTFTEEACPNGLAYSQQGAVYQHCAYNWNVDCGRKKSAEPIASPGCPWQFGLFPIVQNGRCSIDYFACEWGVPETKRCSPEGLFYDDRIKGCQWADQLGCKSEALLNFKCPPEDEDNPYWPYPRYYHDTRDVIVCVNEQPRLVHCNEDQMVDPGSLACMDLHKKKKKKL